MRAKCLLDIARSLLLLEFLQPVSALEGDVIFDGEQGNTSKSHTTSSIREITEITPANLCSPLPDDLLGRGFTKSTFDRDELP